MSGAGLATAIIEGISLAVQEIPDEIIKKKLNDKIEELRGYIKQLESGINNRDSVIAELKNELEKLRDLLKDKGVL
jgi:predicted RNase H-like nuclease (RuvC/YqgF family)